MVAATIKDVARQAGVSTATVSHVVNGSRFVSDGTASRVRQAVESLGYVANVNARGLRSSVSNRIGLLVPEVSDYFPVNILDPIEDVLVRAGYQLILGYTHNNIDMERKQVEFFSYQKIDGLLLFPAYGDHSYLEETGFPVVCLDRPADNFACDCVAANNRKAVRDSVAMMLDAGHRDVGALFGDDRNPTSRQRRKGYEQAFRDRGLPAPSALIRRNIVRHEDADAAARDLLAQGVTALYTTDIVLTVGALKCLQREKRRIPRDVAIFGWGDCKWTELTNPPLTVMRHPNRDIGRKAAEMLLKRISGQAAGPFRALSLPAEIIRRESF